MLLLDRYLLRNFLTPFLLCFFGILSIWLIFDLQSNISEFLDAGVKFTFIAYYYLTQVPQFMMICIPVGLLLSSLFCLSRMSRSNEIISMLATGQSLPRLLLPLYLFGALCTGLCVVLNYEWAPHADSLRKELRAGIKKNGNDTLSGQMFLNRTNRRVWFIKTMSSQMGKKNNSLQGVSITEQAPNGRFTTKWYAKSALYIAQKQLWLLSGGKVVRFAEDGTQTEETFQTLEIQGWSETPWRIITSSQDPDSLSVPELRKYLLYNADFSDKQLAPFRTHLQHRWALPFQSLVVVLFAGPLSIVYSRRGMLSGIAGAIFLYGGMLFMNALMLAFGKGQIAPPYIAAWLPVALLGLAGLYFLYVKGTNREFFKLNDLLPGKWRKFSKRTPPPGQATRETA